MDYISKYDFVSVDLYTGKVYVNIMSFFRQILRILKYLMEILCI